MVFLEQKFADPFPQSKVLTSCHPPPKHSVSLRLRGPAGFVQERCLVSSPPLFFLPIWLLSCAQQSFSNTVWARYSFTPKLSMAAHCLWNKIQIFMVFKALAMFLEPSSSSSLLLSKTHAFSSSASAKEEIAKCTMMFPNSGPLLISVPAAGKTVLCAFWTTVQTLKPSSNSMLPRTFSPCHPFRIS